MSQHPLWGRRQRGRASVVRPSSSQWSSADVERFFVDGYSGRWLQEQRDTDEVASDDTYVIDLGPHGFALVPDERVESLTRRLRLRTKIHRTRDEWAELLTALGIEKPSLS